MENALTFAQLSDPHLSTLDGARWRELANKRLLGYLSWRRRRRAEHRGEVLEALRRDRARLVRALVITGDPRISRCPMNFARRGPGWNRSAARTRRSCRVTMMPMCLFLGAGIIPLGALPGSG
jgi:3',5'-cyclic AMP phosphodiesterase CpdA